MKFYYQLLSFILVLCFLSTIKAQDDFFSSDKSEIAKTKANKISFKTIYASSVSYNINKFKFSEWKYDKNGNLIECIRYEHGDNIIEYKQSYNYDLNGNLILAKIIFHDNSMKICRQHYKGTIKIDSSTFFISANHIDTTEFRYSFYDDGRVIKTEDMDQPGKIYSITNYTYNADGRLIGKYFDRVNKKISNTRTIYKYDPLGNNIEETCFNAFDSINYKYSYTYDKNKLKVFEKRFNSLPEEIIQSKIFYYYDEDGKLIKTVETAVDESKQLQTTDYKYDNKNNLIESTERNPANIINFKWITEYKYYK